LLLDRSAEVGDPLCGGFLSWRTAARLKELGIDPAQLGARRVERLALFAGTSHVEVALPAAGYGLSRHALDSALRSHAVRAGVQLEIDTARGLEGGAVIGRDRRWTGDGLFLATGKHDVRGEPRPRRSGDPALGLRLRLSASSARQQLLGGRIELHLFERGYAGIVLQEDGSSNVCLALRKSALALHQGDPERLLEQLAQVNPAFAERLGPDWRGGTYDTVGAVPYGYIAQRTASGVFRLGDQAAVIPSLAGEGMAIALASGSLAAQHWLRHGATAAHAYQQDFARRAFLPVRTAALGWGLAESRRIAPLAITLANRMPALLRWLMEATRIEVPGSLARRGAAS
jgi:flavin-dependent dehydrogenase